MPSTRWLALGAAGVALVGCTGLAAAGSPRPGAHLGTGIRVGLRFATSLVVALVLGGGLAAVAPGYARATVDAINEDPAGALGWGLVVGIAAPVLLVLLAVTIIGLVVAIPGFIVLFVVGVAGNAVTVLWLGWTLVGEVGGSAAVAGAVVYALLAAVPVLGGLLTTLVGLLGLGEVSRRLYRDRREEDRQRTTRAGPRH